MRLDGAGSSIRDTETSERPDNREPCDNDAVQYPATVWCSPRHSQHDASVPRSELEFVLWQVGGSAAEWLACWTQAQEGLGSNRSRDAVG